MTHRLTRHLLTLFLVAGLAACGSAAQETNQDDPNQDPCLVDCDPNQNDNQNDPNQNDPNQTDPNQTDPGSPPPGILMQGSLERDTDPHVSPETLAQLTAGNRDFAFDLFAALLEEEGDDENVFISPHSISLALTMAYAGAANDTKDQMAQALRISLGDDVHSAFNALDLELAKRSETEVEEGDNFTLNIVNQTWGQEGFEFDQDFLDLLALHYDAGLLLVDFTSEADEIRQAINEWVEYITHDRIKDLLPENSVNELTRYILVNAIYFYGSWANSFNEDHTETGPFHSLDNGPVDVELMNQTYTFGYHADDDFLAVSMPYVGEEVSMISFMPADDGADFRAWEADLTRDDFDYIAANVAAQREVNLTFPKFQTESDLSLVNAMRLLGMDDAFDACDADFENLTGSGPCIPQVSLYISDIFHKSFVSVDEEGTEAAAATAVIFGTTDAEPDPPVEVRFDRPFYYAIFDHETETILFLGRLIDID